MVLVDTSVFLDFLNKKDNTAVKKFNTVLELKIPFGITGHIYQEILQGAATKKDFDVLKDYLDTFTFYAPLDSRQTYAKAAQIYFDCRRKGLTIRSTIDCLIVQIVREHKLQLLHNDKDFDAIKTVVTDIKFL